MNTPEIHFKDMIGPQNLVGLIKNTAPFLFEGSFATPPVPAEKRLAELAAGPRGFLTIIHNAERLRETAEPTNEEHLDYFALCLAAHHATVATFVPTDVDTKIRGILWTHRDRTVLRRMFELALEAHNWDVRPISTRWTERSGVGPVSGHNGEMLGVFAGALGAFLREGDTEFAEAAAETIHKELERELHEFYFVLKERNQEVEILRLSMSIIHNLGDLDQGISFWKSGPHYAPSKVRFGRLAHENTAAFGGRFNLPAALYKKVMASEGHRHYPLRGVKGLRRSPDLLLPLGPFFDPWGEVLGAHPELTIEDRAEIATALVTGCKKIKGQLGYFRALAGFFRTLKGRVEALTDQMPASARSDLKDPEIRRHIQMPQVSFESTLKKQAQAIIGGFR
ncbi:MAG: hypothetical protein RL417_2244 [Pseudomonadota bacterium]|jgi:hypothetical protein